MVLRAGEVPQQPQQPVLMWRVQVIGWLIQRGESYVLGQCPHNVRTLLLATGKGGGQALGSRVISLGYPFRVESQLVAYIDESSAPRPPAQQEYMVCAALIDSDDLERVRNELLPLRLPGQIKLHWTDERSARRRKIVETLSGIDSMQAIITHRSEASKKTERYRRKCLEQLYFELSEMHVHYVTLESRQGAQNRRDIEHIVALQAQGQSAGIRLRHVRGGDDPLLWIPDAVLGALNSAHLGEKQYWDKLYDKVVLNRPAPNSL